MLHKCVAIGGVPATGKTTLMKKILTKFTYQNFKFGLLRGHFIKEKNVASRICEIKMGRLACCYEKM